MKRVLNDEARRKMSEARKRTPVTEATRKKLSAAKKADWENWKQGNFKTGRAYQREQQ